MSVAHTFRNVSLALIAVALLIFAGCYKNKHALAPRDQAKIDRAFAGDWKASTTDGSTASIVVRVLNDRDYYVEFQGAEDDNPSRSIGYVVDFAGAKFAQLRDLNPDGTVADEHWLMRVELTDGKLRIRQLKEEFFNGKPVETAEQLRETIRANVDNDAMYDDGEMIVATREHGGGH